jgi:dihydroneopterin aldolase
MVTINLTNLLFHAYHGVHDEEKVLGGSFEVNIFIKYQPLSLPINRLEDTINYVTVYELLKARMHQPTELLETVATEVAAQILAQFSIAHEVNISITKLHPPITSIQGSVGVSFNLKRNS